MSVTLNDMTANRLQATEPQRGNGGKLHILGMTAFTGATDDFTTDSLVLACQNFPIPKTSSNMIEMRYMNESRKFAGNPTFEDMSVSYKDLIITSVRVAKILYDWRQTVHNVVNGRIGYQVDYKKNGYVVLFDSKGSNQTMHKVYGMWPSSFDPGDIDQDDDNYVRCSITLTIDKVQYDATATAPTATWSSTTYPA